MLWFTGRGYKFWKSDIAPRCVYTIRLDAIVQTALYFNLMRRPGVTLYSPVRLASRYYHCTLHTERASRNILPYSPLFSNEMPCTLSTDRCPGIIAVLSISVERPQTDSNAYSLQQAPRYYRRTLLPESLSCSRAAVSPTSSSLLEQRRRKCLCGPLIYNQSLLSAAAEINRRGSAPPRLCSRAANKRVLETS